ncbi:MAG: hypothetical protein IJF59_03155 [Clostridia bacterium]|nr:hypothetical protein [Clostridia bacterium]
MLWACLLPLLLGGLFWGLFRSGLMVVKATRAVLFLGGRGGRSARFTRCSGRLWRMVPATGDLHFVLDSELSEGALSVTLRGRGGAELLRLTPLHPTGTVEVPPGERLRLEVRLERASGWYALDWTAR